MAPPRRAVQGKSRLPARPATPPLAPGGSSGVRPGARVRPRPAVVPEEAVDEAARRLRVLGHPLRLQALELLAGGPRSVSDLAQLLGVEHQLVSKHLSELLRVGVVLRQQEGNFALYSLPDALTIKAVALLCRSVIDDRAHWARAASGDEPPTNRPPF